MSEEKKETEEIPTIDLGDIIGDKIASMIPSEKDLYLRILFLLNQSERYIKFIDDNFDIHTAVNDEDKSIDLAVIEKPTVEQVDHKSHELGLDTARSLKAHMYLKSLGVEKSSEAVKKMYEIFGGTDENAIVASATDADISKEIKALRTAEKFKA
jgi:hypothetical protein